MSHWLRISLAGDLCMASMLSCAEMRDMLLHIQPITEMPQHQWLPVPSWDRQRGRTCVTEQPFVQYQAVSSENQVEYKDIGLSLYIV